jgi:hypothetical protein
MKSDELQVLLSCIWEVRGSNLGRIPTILTGISHRFSQFVRENSGIIH